MTKNYYSIFALSVLAFYCFLIWPSSSPVAPFKTESQDLNRAVARNHNPVVPDRTSRLQSVKPVAHREEPVPSARRYAPGTVFDHRLQSQTEVAEVQGYGSYPSVDLAEMNAHKAYVLKAHQDPAGNSGAISIVGKREKFDLSKYNSDPSYYLDTVEPGRAFDTAPASSSAGRLKRLGHASIPAIQNKPVSLQAVSESGMPVSFTVFDGGHFQNGLSTITVKAAADGVATAEYTPTSGVVNQTRIRAASPVSTGSLQWTVFVHLSNLTETD